LDVYASDADMDARACTFSIDSMDRWRARATGIDDALVPGVRDLARDGGRYRERSN